MLLTYWTMRMALEEPEEQAGAPSGVTIRQAADSLDLAIIARLYGEAFSADPWPQDWTSFPGYDPEGVFIAEEERKAIGFLVSYQRGEEGYISVVATAPAHRRRGIARALINRALVRFRSLGLSEVTIDVRAENTAAIRCYESVGFGKVGEFEADEMCRTPQTAD